MFGRYVGTSIANFFKLRITMFMFSVLAATSLGLSINAAVSGQEDYFLRTTAAHFDVYIKLILSAVITLIASIFVFADIISRGYERVYLMSHRRHLVFLTKLLILTLIIIIVQVVNSILYMAPLFGKISDEGFMGWYLSNLLGPIIVQLLVASVVIAIINFRSKQTTLLSLLLVFVAGPLASMVMQHSLNAAPITVQVESNMYEYSTADANYVNADYYYYDASDERFQKDYEEYIDSRKYDLAANFDVFYQSQLILNLFKEENYPLRTNVFKWEMKEIEANIDSNSQIKYRDHNGDEATLAVLVTQDEARGQNTSFESRIEDTFKGISTFMSSVKNDPTTPNTTQSWEDLFEDADLINRLQFVDEFKGNVDLSTAADKLRIEAILTNVITDVKELSTVSATAGFAYRRYASINNVENTELLSSFVPADSDGMFGNYVINGQTIKVFEANNYVKTWTIVAVWLSIILAALGLGFYGFTRRDISKLA